MFSPVHVCLSFTCSWVGVVWSQVCGPTCSSCMLGSSGGSLLCRSVALASGRTLSLGFSRLGFLPLAFVRTWVGRLRSCLGSCILLGGNSPSLVLVFTWRFLQFGCPSSWSFLGIFAWVLSSRFQCLLIAWGGYGWSLVVRSL